MTEYSDELYGDIINIHEIKSKRHSTMSIESRASQFASFDALTTLNKALSEVAKLSFKQLCNIVKTYPPKGSSNRCGKNNAEYNSNRRKDT